MNKSNSNLQEIFTGCLGVADKGYTQPSEDHDDEEQIIPGLDKPLEYTGSLSFQLKYPFEQPFEGTVKAKATLRNVIDAIRAGYRTMYRGTTNKAMKHLINREVQGKYGIAYHEMGDLVIEIIELDQETGELHIYIGS